MSHNALYDIKELPDIKPSIASLPVVVQHTISCVKNLSHYYISSSSLGIKINGNSKLTISKISTGIYQLSYCFNQVPAIIITPVISSQDVLIVVGIYNKTTTSAIIQTLKFPSSSLEFTDCALDILVKID
jgi:hypothetical protein